MAGLFASLACILAVIAFFAWVNNEWDGWATVIVLVICFIVLYFAVSSYAEPVKCPKVKEVIINERY